MGEDSLMDLDVAITDADAVAYPAGALVRGRSAPERRPPERVSLSLAAAARSLWRDESPR